MFKPVTSLVNQHENHAMDAKWTTNYFQLAIMLIADNRFPISAFYTPRLLIQSINHPSGVVTI